MDTRDRIELGILGVLADGDAALPEIRETLQHTVGRHVTAGYGSLGPVLNDLEETELVVRIDGTYTLTDAGEERLEELLRTPIDDVRDLPGDARLFTKLTFLHHLPPDACDEELAALADHFRQAREEWSEVHGYHAAEVDSAVGFRRSLMDLNARVADVYVEWIEELRERPHPRT